MSSRIDLRTLEQIDKLAVTGAVGAAERVTGLTDIATTVETSRLTVGSNSHIDSTREGDDTIAIQLTLDGQLEGRLLTRFDRASAVHFAEAFMPMLASAI